MWYLDCFHPGALLGERFPVNSYGPASLADVIRLRGVVGHNFSRTEVATATKGQNPLPRDLWPDVPRPR